MLGFETEKHLGSFIAGCLIGTMLIMGFFALCKWTYKDGYKDGQIDAIAGKIIYKQITIKKWERK